MPTLLSALWAARACTTTATAVVVAEETLVEGVFVFAPALGACLVEAFVLGIVLACLAEGSTLWSGEQALTLGTLAAAVACAWSFAVLLELGLELLFGDMLLDELLDR